MNNNDRRVVVTGLGAITPIGNTVEETWQAMKTGKNGIDKITLFDTTGFKATLAAEVKNFEVSKYLDVNETLRTDRYVQFAVAAADMAVKESGIEQTVDPKRFAVQFGTGIGGIGTFEREHTKLLETGDRRVSPLFIPMLIANMAAGTISIKHNCQGSSMPSVTACASGSHAIGEAYRMIKHNYADAVITGGAEAAITPSAVAGFVNMLALSVSSDKDAASLPFDKRRAGFVIGEGSVALVLEEYERAKKRGATIYGEICGYGSTSDAYHITAPHPQAEGSSRAMIEAIEQSGYTSSDFVYINAHGTGTPMNDKLEALAINKAFNGELTNVLTSSTKSMTGHMLGAAGAVEAMACLLALKDGILPPTLNLEEVDEQCNINLVKGKAVKAEITLALSNSFGFGGHNACLAFRKVQE